MRKICDPGETVKIVVCESRKPARIVRTTQNELSGVIKELIGSSVWDHTYPGDFGYDVLKNVCAYVRDDGIGLPISRAVICNSDDFYGCARGDIITVFFGTAVFVGTDRHGNDVGLSDEEIEELIRLFYFPQIIVKDSNGNLRAVSFEIVNGVPVFDV